MSYNTAEKIVNLYSDLLVNMGEKSEYKVYGYSDLQGYNILDVDNALKIVVAYSVFNLNKSDENALKNLKAYSSNAGGAVVSFFTSFVPDEVIPEIDKLDPNDKNSLLDFIDLTNNYKDSDLYKTFLNQETHGSFLKFCLDIDRSDINYWEKIYARLSLTWDTKDVKDPIFFIITNKTHFFKI